MLLEAKDIVMAFGSFRGAQGMWMHFLQRKVAIDEANPACESVYQQFDGRHRLLAVGTLEITVFEHGDRGVGRTEHVVDSADGKSSFNFVVLAHGGSV